MTDVFDRLSNIVLQETNEFAENYRCFAPKHLGHAHSMSNLVLERRHEVPINNESVIIQRQEYKETAGKIHYFR
jgi:hypothetical protein